jgi:fermentation-respiration switch protein FrsA (DUF1100 family)
MFDYRGYGASEGEPSEEGIYEDTLAAYDWLVSHSTRPERLIIIGQSLGNSPAARLAAERPVSGLVLVAPFTNLPEAAAERLPWLPLRLIPWRHSRFDVAEHLARVSAPVLLIATQADELVPFSNSLKVRGLTAHSPAWIEDRHLTHNGLLAAIARDGRLTAGIHKLRQASR